MPTRTYYFPKDFKHVEAILRSSNTEIEDHQFQNFRDQGIAPLFTSLDIAIVLGVGPTLIKSILKNRGKHYRSFTIKKSNGDDREICTPRIYLKVIQWWILDNILSMRPTHPQSFGFCRGRSIHDNARHHSGSSHILNVDIKSFFDSVTDEQVNKVFLDMGYHEKTTKTLSNLCTLEGHLPQGAPTSPSLANLVFFEIDKKLEELATSNEMKYSRYADDLTFSRDSFIPEIFTLKVQEVLMEYNFELNPEKTRFSGPGTRKEVTGLICGDFIQPPIAWRKKNRARLHTLWKKESLDQNDINYLLGLKGYASQFPDAVQMLSLLKSAESLLGHQNRDRIQT